MNEPLRLKKGDILLRLPLGRYMVIFYRHPVNGIDFFWGRRRKGDPLPLPLRKRT